MSNSRRHSEAPEGQNDVEITSFDVTLLDGSLLIACTLGDLDDKHVEFPYTIHHRPGDRRPGKMQPTLRDVRILLIGHDGH